jgi:hypothetical protein
MDDQQTREFPKMLYEGGVARDEITQRPVHHSKTRVVNNSAEEAEARAEGFRGTDEPADSEPAADFNGADPAAFDHDGDGKAGGGPKGGQRKKPAA